MDIIALMNWKWNQARDRIALNLPVAADRRTADGHHH
jgi:hypothetical protein